MTNYEHIKAMSVDEMAKYLTNRTLKDKFDNLSENDQTISATYMDMIGKSLYRQYFMWLKSEVEEE